jgi:3-(3-hydroxy-phenyl)propionate hydroxylase
MPAAQARDEKMLAARAAGSSPDGAVNNPPLGNGFLMAGSPQAGNYFPQFVTSRKERLDDALGPGAWMITRSRRKEDASKNSLQVIELDDPRLGPFKSQLESWLAKHDADAVLVRPDRYVFGTGSLDVLAQAWSRV